VYHDELIAGDVRLVMIVPSWFPKAHVAFDWNRVQGDRVSVVFVLRGTMQVRPGGQSSLGLVTTSTKANDVVCWMGSGIPISTYLVPWQRCVGTAAGNCPKLVP